MRLSAIPDVTLPSRILKQLWPRHRRLAASNVMSFTQGRFEKQQFAAPDRDFCPKETRGRVCSRPSYDLRR